MKEDHKTSNWISKKQSDSSNSDEVKDLLQNKWLKVSLIVKIKLTQSGERFELCWFIYHLS